jgi:hypothetical protein
MAAAQYQGKKESKAVADALQDQLVHLKMAIRLKYVEYTFTMQRIRRVKNK